MSHNWTHWLASKTAYFHLQMTDLLLETFNFTLFRRRINLFIVQLCVEGGGGGEREGREWGEEEGLVT